MNVFSPSDSIDRTSLVVDAAKQTGDGVGEDATRDPSTMVAKMSGVANYCTTRAEARGRPKDIVS